MLDYHKSVSESDEKYHDGFYYVDDGTGIMITECDSQEEKIEIPSEIDGLPVTVIGFHAFYECENLISVRFPETLKIIGDSAFYNRHHLKEVILPDGLTTIGKETFGECTGLQEIQLPDSISVIEEDAFWGTGIQKLMLPKSMTSLCDCLFMDCRNLTEVIIPHGVTSIGKYAFQDCENLKRLIIPETVTKIGFCALNNCSNLKEIHYSGTKQQWTQIEVEFNDYINSCLLEDIVHYNYQYK